MHSKYFLLSLFLLSLQVDGQLCEEYRGELCKNYINYPVYSAKESSQIIAELTLQQLELNSLIFGASQVDPPCANAAIEYSCTTYFPRCIQNNSTALPQPSCRSLCLNFLNECRDVLTTLGKDVLLPQCVTSAASGLLLTDDPGCQANTLPLELPDGFECKEPLIRNPDGVTNPSTICFGYCCVPCPTTHYLFPKGQMRAVDDIIIATAIISLISATFVIVSFSVMKNKKNFPSYLVLLTSCGLFLFFLPSLFSVGNPTRVRCVTSVTPSSPGYNTNPLCQAQSVFVVYGVLTASGWYFCLVLNIHLTVVWRKEMDRYFPLLLGLVWGLPVISLIAYNAADVSGYRTGIWCTMKDGGWVNGALMVPLALYIFSSFFLNIVTLHRIFKVARGTKSTLTKIVRLQIRPFSFVFTIVLVFMFYWIHFEVALAPRAIKSGEVPQFFQDWILCIISGEGQDKCSEISVPNMFNVGLFAFAEFGIHFLGVIIFIFFGARHEVFGFWFSKMTGKEFKYSSNNGSSTGGGRTSSKVDLGTIQIN